MAEVEQAVSEYAAAMQELHMLLDKLYPIRLKIPTITYIPEDAFSKKEVQEARAKVDKALEKWRAVAS